MEKYTVKVRGRYGTSSFDITIPAKIARKYNIKHGDIFEVTVENKDNLKITYTLIYKNK